MHLQSVSPGPGVAFFQFARLLFNIFYEKNSLVIFLSSPIIPENLVQFCCVFCKLDHFKRAVGLILKMYYMPFGLTLLIHKQIHQSFRDVGGR